MPVRRHPVLSLCLVILLLAGLVWPPARLAQGPDEPWLIRLPCEDEATFARIVDSGMRVLLWQDGQVYALASAAQYAKLDVTPEILRRQAAQGDYYVIWAAPVEVPSLEQRYGFLAPLGGGFYLLGLPPDALPLAPAGPRYTRRLPNSLALPLPPPQELLAPRPVPGVDKLVNLVSNGRLAQGIAELQDDTSQPGPNALRSRYSMDPGLDVAAAYITRELGNAGLEVSNAPFTVTDRSRGTTRVVNNIVGTLRGRRPEAEGFYIVSAHYDSTATRDPRWSSESSTLPAPGADDDASGTSAVLEAARLLGRRSLTYGVRFVLFAGEEQGLQGSRAYVEELPKGSKILGVINLDMIGYDANRDGKIEVHAGVTQASRALADAMVRNMERYAPGLHPKVFTRNADTRSDHASFWDRGYPAVLVAEDWDEASPHYHTPQDTLDTLNMDYCTAVARAAVGTLGELAGLAEADLSSSRKVGAVASPILGSVAYTITLQNSGTLTATTTLSDPLAAGLTLAGNPQASEGSVQWDREARTVHWQGAIRPQGTVTIFYRAFLLPGYARLGSLALADDGQGRLYGLPASVLPLRRWGLPLTLGGP